ncbi:L-rhamnose-binding lectin SML-like [Cololabis saira]|uniref:L-rhamnose-binding lectin SML-like n=1 Tax=Cololabis saira TaxID=129043 RepID=UPI002AD35F54|nr:L-rhamnose-binding lectin SML-like [Cololabis saira]
MLLFRLTTALSLAAACLALYPGDFPERVITCDDLHNIHRLKCDSGVISVISALYGRVDRETCSEDWAAQRLTNTHCSQAGTVDVIKNRCNGKQVCEINTNVVRTSEPCSGVYKYIETKYICLPATHLIVCQKSLAWLTCGKGQIISVYGANYGRRDQTTCSYQKPSSETMNVNCSNPTKAVAARCNGKQDCKIPATNSVFKDPCSDTYKYLEVAYTCESISHNSYHGLLSKFHW